MRSLYTGINEMPTNYLSSEKENKNRDDNIEAQKNDKIESLVLLIDRYFGLINKPFQA